jgi:ElaB/YqjD/DUF883 family membrane-anchored ribosome-binding protein
MQPATEVQKKMNGAASAVHNDGRQLVDNTLNSIEKASNDFGRQAGAMVSRIGETTQGYYKSSEDYVKAHPVKGVAMAAGAGLVLGGLLAAAIRRKK